MLIEYQIPYISKIFKQFAEIECKGKSNLYYLLSHQIAEDDELLKFCKQCRERQPIPNLFLGAVHYLLLKKVDEDLAVHYPSISNKVSKKIPYDLFKKFCLENEASIRTILSTRIVQTNAVNRTAYLMPIISSLYSTEDKLTVVDIGASSGLNLNYDRYQYNYGSDLTFGKGSVMIKSKILQGELPDFRSIKKASRKIGIDQNTLDLRKSDNSLWLKGLIWPDLRDRFGLIESAIEEFRLSEEVELMNGNRISQFREIINTIPLEESIFIYHTHVLYQFTIEERVRFREMLDEIGKNRHLNYLAVEGGGIFDYSSYPKGQVFMELTKYSEGKKSLNNLGKVDAHGRWIEWNSIVREM
ncbi:MAG: DUF2332 domain-containing protein [Bacteroidota bacterium]